MCGALCCCSFHLGVGPACGGACVAIVLNCMLGQLMGACVAVVLTCVRAACGGLVLL